MVLEPRQNRDVKKDINDAFFIVLYFYTQQNTVCEIIPKTVEAALQDQDRLLQSYPP